MANLEQRAAIKGIMVISAATKGEGYFQLVAKFPFNRE